MVTAAGAVGEFGPIVALSPTPSGRAPAGSAALPVGLPVGLRLPARARGPVVGAEAARVGRAGWVSGWESW
ncbi:hypothetical protein ACFQ77_11545 [Streptomyces virginiae]|uniref:hypothetical protein n=1 Tax=Streptomyces virginiae TaxID=1961 RepID=UPI00369B4C72